MNTKRIFGLDILRAFAIWAVMVVHSFPFLQSHVNGRTLKILLFDGVTIFFVLSGYLIGLILIRTLEKGTTWRALLDFWVRRWLRTLPAYIFILLVLILLWRLFNPQLQVDLLPFLYFGQSQRNDSLWLFPESWSLCVEEWFYVIIPLLLWTISRFFRDLRKMLLIFIIGIIFGVTLFRIFNSYDISDAEIYNHTITKGLWTRLDSIMYGVLAAYLTYFNIWKRIMTWFWIGIVGLIAWKIEMVLFDFSIYRNILALPLLSISTMLMIPFLATVERKKGSLAKAITFTSQISYSLYLVHFTLFHRFFFPVVEKLGITMHTSPFSDLFGLSYYLIVSYGAGLLLHISIELPFIRTRDKLGSASSTRC